MELEESISLSTEEIITYDNCEWCFQFDDDEPRPFATALKTSSLEDPNLKFILPNNSNSNFTFSHNGKTFKLFARELTQSDESSVNKTE